MRPLPVLVLFACAACLLVGARAAAQSFTLVYDFAGRPGNQVSTPYRTSSLIPGLSATNLVRGPGISAATGSGSFAASRFSTGGWNADDWFGWSVAPTAGDRMTLSQLVIPERRSATGIRAFSIRSSLDNFASDLYRAAIEDNTSVRSHTVALGSAFAGRDTGVEFRIYGYEAESQFGTWRLGISATASENPDRILPELRLQGVIEPNVVTAPEPSAWVLATLGLGVLAVRLKTRCAGMGRLV